MLGKKGQSALEYLMTYGWAILIIIIVGGVLYYYGVFSPSKLVGESKVGFSKIQVDQWGITGSDLNLILENRAGDDINITEIYIDGTAGLSDSIYMNPGEKLSTWQPVSIPSNKVPSAGEAYRFDVTIEYFYPNIDATGSTRFNSTGTLSGTA